MQGSTFIVLKNPVGRTVQWKGGKRLRRSSTDHDNFSGPVIEICAQHQNTVRGRGERKR